MWYVYILKSLRDKKYYTGYTGDLRKRFKQHNNGAVYSTRHRNPLVIVYYEAGLDEEKAQLREKYLKTSWGKRYLKGRI
jgi:putative endonuclease